MDADVWLAVGRRRCFAKAAENQLAGPGSPGPFDLGRSQRKSRGALRSRAPALWLAAWTYPFLAGALGLAAGFGAAFSGIVPSGFRTTKSSFRSIPLKASESRGEFRSRTVSVKV